MRYLKELLKEIDSLEKLERFVKNDENNTFEYLDNNDLKLDSEYRVYDDKVEYTNKIITCDKLQLSNSSNIKFVNCIFLGQLNISQKHHNNCDIYLDYCIFLKGLTIHGVDNGINVTLESVNAKSIYIANSNLQKLSLSTCRVARFSLIDNKVHSFRTFECEFLYPVISKNNIQEVSFPYEQIDIKKLEGVKIKQAAEDINSLNFNAFKYRSNIDWENLSETEKRSIKLDTLNFFQENSNVYLNKSINAHLKYLQIINTQENSFLKLVFIIMGAFLKPGRIVLTAIITLFITSILISLPIFQFNILSNNGEIIIRSLTFIESFYFAGITFTTVGYGDITPVGSAQYFVFLIGVLGIIFTSSFIVSLVRKYAET